MTNQHTIKATPADKTITLDELRKFINECEHANLPDTAIITAGVTMRGHLKRIEATG